MPPKAAVITLSIVVTTLGLSGDVSMLNNNLVVVIIIKLAQEYYKIK